MQTLLLKAAAKGEGSRGGHIIGHTKNGGHPIYASTAATSRKYKDLGADDHVHARDMHRELAEHFASKAKQTDIHDEERKHARASASNHRKQAQGHSKKYAEIFGHYRNALTTAAMAAGASHKAPSNRVKEKAYLEGQDKVSAAREVYDGKPFGKSLGKSLDALHPSDSLHQMGAQFAQKHPNMSASEHMAQSSKFAKTGQPHMAIGHMMAASFKSSVAKKSLAAQVLTDYLSKAEPKTLGVTSSGKPIHNHDHPSYSGVKAYTGFGTESRRANTAQRHELVSSVLASHPNHTKADHHQAWAVHRDKAMQLGEETPQGAKHLGIAMGHFHAKNTGGLPKAPKVAKSLSKAAAKGEGSRGGKVMGHYASGAPKYGKAENASVAASVFSGHAKMLSDKAKRTGMKSDHAAAAEAYMTAAAKHHTALNVRGQHPDRIDKHSDAIGSHQMMAQMHANHAQYKKSLTPADLSGGIGGFNDMLKASGLTMWAPKADRAELTHLN